MDDGMIPPFPYDLQLVCFHLLIYLLWKHRDDNLTNNNHSKNNNIMTFEYAHVREPFGFDVSSLRFLRTFSLNSKRFSQVDRDGEKDFVVVDHHRRNRHRRRRRRRSCFPAPP